MKLIVICIVFCLFLANDSNAQSIHSLTARLADDTLVELAGFKGRKLLFVTVDGIMPDSIAKDVRRFQEKFMGNFAVFVLPITDSKSNSGRYSQKQDKSRNSKVGVYFLKDYKGLRVFSNEGIFPWLTNYKLNGHFDVKQLQVNQKFFIDEVGSLYGVIGPEYKLDSKLVSRIAVKPLVAK
jgi:hypothetical protein